MPAPVRNADFRSVAAPPILPKVVVIHATDVAADPQADTTRSSRLDLLVEEDAIARHSGPTPEVDRVQEEVMTAISPDGRPPHRPLRLAEWKWVVLVFGALFASAIALALMSNVAWPTILFASVIVLVLAGAAIPTWGAGLLRGGEERRARRTAVVRTQRGRAIR